MILREAEPGDAAAVRALHDAAFGGPAEGRLVERLTADGLVVASVVAVVDDAVVGHVLYSVLPIRTEAGGIVSGAALAPLAVLAEYRRRGVGAALVERGMALCRARGIAAVVVLGDPAYYGRFGFSHVLARDLSAPWSGDTFMALELAPGCLRGVAATAVFPPAFDAVR